MTFPPARARLPRGSTDSRQAELAAWEEQLHRREEELRRRAAG